MSTPVDVTIPTVVAPIILSATTIPVSAKAGKVTLTWSDVVGEIQYRVEWSADNFVTVAGRIVAVDATTFTTPDILGGAYQFRVRVQFASGWVSSTPVEVTIPTVVVPVIRNTTATSVSANAGKVTLIWSDVFGEIQYRVEWSADSFVTVSGRIVAANATTFTTPDILGGDYQFRVRAQFASGWVTSTLVNVTIPKTVF